MPIDETFYGFIETTTDALLLFEACRRGMLPKIGRRLQEKERSIIRSGSVFIFDEKESGIKRWTDGRTWSPSRILGNFLIYRELDNKEALKLQQLEHSERFNPYNDVLSLYYDSNKRFSSSEEERQRDRNLIGSLTDTYKFLKNGLIKKTISIHINGSNQHLVSYYSKEDVISSKLATPSSTSGLSSLQISSDLLLKQSFRVPPSVEFAELILKGPSLSPPSSTSSSSNASLSSSRRISDPTNTLNQFSSYDEQQNQRSNHPYSSPIRKFDDDVETNSRKYARTTNEAYAGESTNNRILRKHANSDNFNMPPLSMVTENIPFFHKEKNEINRPAFQNTYRNDLMYLGQNLTSINSYHAESNASASPNNYYEKESNLYEVQNRHNSNFINPYKSNEHQPYNSEEPRYNYRPYKSDVPTPFSDTQRSLPSPASMIWSKNSQNRQVSGFHNSSSHILHKSLF